jgi:hypothetical protein
LADCFQRHTHVSCAGKDDHIINNVVS